MKLNDEELRALKRMKQWNSFLRRYRWALVTGIGSMTGVWIIILNQSFRFWDQPSVLAFVAPLCFINFGICGAGLGYVFAHWKGDYKTQLLVRLTEELTKEQ